jgi:putative hydrolase of HD superfamily
MKEKKISDFLFEAASLKRTPRTGYQFLGRGHENVAEHSFGVVMLSYVLGRLSGRANLERLLSMAIFHDLAEARTGDLNYVNKRYVTALEPEAFRDAIEGLPFAEELKEVQKEWLEGESLEAKLAADADQLDMMIELRRLLAHGWTQAGQWLFYAEKRLRTKEARALAKQILHSDPDGWWFEKRDELWVNPTVESTSNEPAAWKTGSLKSKAAERKAAKPKVIKQKTVKPKARKQKSVKLKSVKQKTLPIVQNGKAPAERLVSKKPVSKAVPKGLPAKGVSSNGQSPPGRPKTKSSPKSKTKAGAKAKSKETPPKALGSKIRASKTQKPPRISD